MRLAGLLLAAAACGNPDNLVIGAISASPDGKIPVAFIDSVRSAISFIGTYTDQNGNKSQRTVVVLSNTAGLCDQLGAHTDYFRNPPESYVALLLYTPLDRVGTFYLGRDQGAGAEIVAASQGAAVTPYFAYANGSYIALTDMSSDGSNARGSFDLIFPDPTVNPPLREFYGKYKVGSCSALGNALLP